MAKQLRAQIDVQATSDRVWEVLTDFAAYPEWNPFITQVRGTARVGERLTNRMQPVGARGVTFRPTVLEADPGRSSRNSSAGCWRPCWPGRWTATPCQRSI